MNETYFMTRKQLDNIIASLQLLDLAQVCRTLCEVYDQQFIGNIEDPKKENVAIVPKASGENVENIRSPTRRWKW